MLKMRKLSSTWSSCLLVTVRRILSYSSASESGICVRRRWYDSVGLEETDVSQMSLQKRLSRSERAYMS